MAVNWTMMITIRQYKCNETGQNETTAARMGEREKVKRHSEGDSKRDIGMDSRNMKMLIKWSAYGLWSVWHDTHIYYNLHWIVVDIFCLFVVGYLCICYCLWIPLQLSIVVTMSNASSVQYPNIIYNISMYRLCVCVRAMQHTFRHLWPKVWCESNGKSVAFS